MEIQSLPIEIPMAEWKNDIQDYMAVYPDIIRELAEAAVSSNNDDTAAWFSKCLKYNLPGSTKQMFGAATAKTFKSLIKGEQLTPEKLKLAHVLGWCVELHHTTTYIYDDVLDQSTTRRRQMCWYKLEDASLTTPNDVIMVENGIFKLLRKNFRHLDYYGDLLELFQRMIFQTARGELMDYLLSKKSVSTFNIETYNAMITDKTGSHTLCLPGILALYLAGVKDPQISQQFITILTELGNFCQVQNDYVDCFITSDITGRIGTDIQENKCSWLAAKFMERANPEQKAIMVECYGQHDLQKVARVKQLYEELNMTGIYTEYKNEVYNKIKIIIEQSSNGLPKELFLNLLNFCVDETKFYKTSLL